VFAVPRSMARSFEKYPVSERNIVRSWFSFRYSGVGLTPVGPDELKLKLTRAASGVKPARMRARLVTTVVECQSWENQTGYDTLEHLKD